MVMLTNRQLIDAPAAGPRRYGLYDAATVMDDLPARLIAAGAQFPLLDCEGVVNVYDANCDTSPVKEFTEGLGYNGADPYWLYAAQRCGTVGRTPAEIAEGVRRTLAAGEQTAVEDVLWTGGPFANEPALATSPATVVAPLAPGAGAAVAALEAAFYAEYGYVGTIHVNTAAYAAVRYADLADRTGGAGVLTTPLGSRWSFGAGYSLTGPGGAAAPAGFAWAFMTSPVVVRRSPVFTPDVVQTMNRTNNQYNALAERVVLHYWACPHVYAVPIPLAAPAVATAPAVPVPEVPGDVEALVEEEV